jgi:hypothetical protein
MSDIVNDILLERLHKVEEELKCERDINRAIQLQLAQLSLQKNPINDFATFHRNKNIELLRQNLTIFQKLIDEIDQNEKMDKKLFNVQLIKSQSEYHKYLFNSLDYLISLFPEHELLLQKIINNKNTVYEQLLNYPTQWKYTSSYESDITAIDTIDVSTLLKTNYTFNWVQNIDENDLFVKLFEHIRFIRTKLKEISDAKFEELKKLQTEKYVKQFKESYEAKKPKIKNFFNNYEHRKQGIDQYKVSKYIVPMLAKNYDQISNIINNYFIIIDNNIKSCKIRQDIHTFFIYVVKHCIEEGNSLYKVYTIEEEQFIDPYFFSKNKDLFTSIEKFNETIKRFEDNLSLYGILYKVKNSSNGYILYNTEYYIIAQEEDGKILYKDGNITCQLSEVTFNPETYEIIEDEE